MNVQKFNHLKNLVYLDRDSWRLRWLKNDKIADSMNGSGYYQVKFFMNEKRVTVGSHRFIYALFKGVPSQQIDHIDRNKANNNINNLRDVSPSLNSFNQKLDKRSKSKITGVIWNKKQKKWHGRIRKDNKEYHLGSFVCPAVALCERKRAEIKLHGEVK